MSEPAPPPNQPSAESIGAALLDMLYAFVLPLFAGFLEPAAAERAARAAMQSYQPRTCHEAMLAARAIAFSLATQDNLRLSMTADLTVTAKLRLRSNANALDRSAERNHAALEKCQANRAAAPHEADMPRDAKDMIARANAEIAAAKAVTKPNPPPAAQAPPAKAVAAVAAALRQSVQPTRSADPGSGLPWANAMTVVADEMTAGASALPPAQRKRELMRARLLGSAARDVIALASGSAAPRPALGMPKT